MKRKFPRHKHIFEKPNFQNIFSYQQNISIYKHHLATLFERHNRIKVNNIHILKKIKLVTPSSRYKNKKKSDIIYNTK